MRNVVRTEAAPKAVGPYSQGCWAGNTLYLSGQIAQDPATGRMVGDGDAAAETERIMKNVLAVLASQDMDFGNVVKAVIYASDIGDFGAINGAYAACFDGNPPARCFVEVTALALGAKVEIDVIAYRE
jgi:2-iminobutanoate/2-iminopropanoate deaminase